MRVERVLQATSRVAGEMKDLNNCDLVDLPRTAELRYGRLARTCKGGGQHPRNDRRWDSPRAMGRPHVDLPPSGCQETRWFLDMCPSGFSQQNGTSSESPSRCMDGKCFIWDGSSRNNAGLSAKEREAIRRSTRRASASPTCTWVCTLVSESAWDTELKPFPYSKASHTRG